MSTTWPGAGEPATGHLPSRARRLIDGPRQGWLALVLLGVMLGVVGLALEDSKWVGFSPSGESQTWWLPLAMVAAGALGFVFAVSRVSTAVSHLVAAFTGTAVILVASAGSISAAPTLLGRLHDLSESFSRFVNDVFVVGARSSETSAFLIVIGAICWTTGYFAALNVFRRNRGMAAVISAGCVLLVNMSITARPQYPYLVVFAFASMLLLVRLNIVEQAIGWQRRHIGDARDVSTLFLRGGAVFVAVAMTGALFLAATASSAPLAGFWRTMDDQLVNLSVQVNRVVGGVTGTTKQVGGLFGTAATVTGQWESSDEPLFTAVTSDGSEEYYRGATYDGFDGLTWYQNDRQPQDVAANADLMAGTSEQLDPTAPGRRSVTTTVTSIGLAGGTLLAPDTPVTTDQETTVRTAGANGPLVTIDFQDAVDPGESYTVTSLVPEMSRGQGGVTASMLAASGTSYPDWIGRYVAITPNSIGQITEDTARRIYNGLPESQRDTYHVAFAIQSFFNRSGTFTYSTDVRGVCGREGIVDCLLLHRIGYCMHYASAMTMMLRVLGIPARLVQGYLPGQLLADGTAYEVNKSAAHAWVEVYFPDYGWLRFDPTPGNNVNGRQVTNLPPGTPVKPAPSAEPTPGEEATPEPSAGVDAATQPLPLPPPPDSGAFAVYAVTALAAAGMVLVVFARRRRRPGMATDQTFDRVTRLATRLGYAPRPSQTAFEYAGTLSDLVPALRQELHVVANAKVESTYARRLPTHESLAVLHRAYSRIRRGFVMLLFKPRRKRPATRR